MLKLNFFNNFTKYISIFIIFLITSACSNKYYLNKRLDNFYFKKNDTYTIYSNPVLDYNDIIREKLRDHLNPLPLLYSNSYASYLVYFDYKKRYLWFPVFRLTIIKNSPSFKKDDEVVYDSLIYSYNTKEIKSLLSSLIIITNDLLYKKYSKNKYIKIPPREISEFSQNKSKLPRYKEDLNNKKIPKRQVIYRLYTNPELYKH